MIRKRLPDLGALLLLFLLPLLLYGSVVWGPKTLLPADILYTFEPYEAAAGEMGVPYPQNHLLGDLILQNYPWKLFLRDSFQSRQLPLWNPYLFAGHPFLANGQHSALYPLSAVFYALPLWRAFGVFAWVQLGLAGMFAYVFARVLGMKPLGGLIAGITFQFSGFLVVSVVHPMIVAGASWLPFILAMVELVIQQRPALAGRPASLPWAVLGSLGLGCQILAGHAENTYFVLLVTALYALWRLGGTTLASWRSAGGTNAQRRRETARSLIRPALWLGLMAVVGVALGAVQLIPLYEVVSTSFRGGETAATLEQVRSWAYPPRRLIAFAVPNFFGNPAHHTIPDLFSWSRVPAPDRGDGQYVYWGMKNYVEGGAYLGLLPLLLSAVALISWLGRAIQGKPAEASGTAEGTPDACDRGRETIPFFGLLSLFSLGCIFGTPLYALVYALPLLKQSHSPFRWVFPLTLSVAMLAGFGLERIRRARESGEPDNEDPAYARAWHDRGIRHALLGATRSPTSVLAALAFWGGLLTLTGVLLSRILFVQLEPLVARAFLSLAGAPDAFPDHRAFYSYEVVWLGLFGWLLTASGIVLRLSRCQIHRLGRPVWELAAVVVLLVDMVSFGYGFHPAVDPTLLSYTPPAIQFLEDQESGGRYATFTPPGTSGTLKANTGMIHGLACVAGYDSLFSSRYRDTMALIEEQDQVAYNRIAPFRSWSSLDSPLTDLLSVRYVVSEVEIPSPKYAQVYADESVRIYENLGALPRAFTLPTSATVVTQAETFERAVQTRDPRHYVILEEEVAKDSDVGGTSADAVEGAPRAQTIPRETSNEVVIEVRTDEPSWLILGDAYFPGWKGFVRPTRSTGASDDLESGEEEVPVLPVNGAFRGVRLEEAGEWTVRLKYSPNSVKVGAFISFLAGMSLLFLAGLFLWRFFYREEAGTSTVQRVAKNSVAPMVLNFFNRIIDFAFAALTARILGPAGMGQYFTAVNIYLWFDTLANFGLDMYLIREVAQERGKSRRVFVNTSLLRLGLFVAVVPILAGFLLGRQALQNPLTQETIWTVGLLYVGLLPGTIANSLTALFRAFEKHEFPAAIQTITTIVKVTLGTLALVGRLGIVGLAGSSVLTNGVTMTILGVLAWRLIWRKLPVVEIPAGQRLWSRMRAMLAASWPLMGSLLLQSLFTGVNVIMLQYFRGDDAVGWYNAATKWVMNMLNIIPSLFTFAVFPVLSRQAAEDRGRLRRSYQLSVKLLMLVALPTSVAITLLARPMVWLLSGRAYLPFGAVALRILVWSILFGWINSLTNYVLIALDRQRYVVQASAARVVFALLANVALVPRFGYAASAWIIIGGELILNVLFAVELRRSLGPMAWGDVIGRPMLAGLGMAAVGWVVARYSVPLALGASIGFYLVSLILVRALTVEDRERLATLLPSPLRRALGRMVL